jgi:zinc-ribbon domain
MTACRRCGHDNPDGATSCSQCGESLPPTRDSSASPPQGLSGPEPVALPRPSFWTPLRLSLLGIGLGLIPLALWLAGWSAGGCNVGQLDASLRPGRGEGLGTAAVLLYLLQLVAGLVCLSSHRTRRVGYGLLTMALVDPVVGAIGCGVIAGQSAMAC